MKKNNKKITDLTSPERQVLVDCLELLREKYKKEEEDCRKFKWICYKYLPQHGEEYIKNINVIEIQDKTIDDLHKEFKEKETFLLSMINARNL